jgi:transposase
MINDQQVRRLKKMLSKGKKLYESALKSGMDEKTARKYRDTGKLPSEIKHEHTWRTRKDPFKNVWEEVRQLLKNEPGLEALTIFRDLQNKYPGKFPDGQLRTLQRQIKKWRATEGPPKEVMFPQIHHPGRLSQSDFTHMTELGITINKQPFEHLVYHFTLTYSNWETGSVCFSESFESLSSGFQEAIWELGGVPEYHQTDCLSTAVNKQGNPLEFTKRYMELMNHYDIKPKRINPGQANENGDIEQSHYRFKTAVGQQLMLRGSRDFVSREEYEGFLRKIFRQRNLARGKKIKLEKRLLKSLPQNKIDAFNRMDVRVSGASTILINHNIYSVNSRLLKEKVRVKVFSEHIEVWYAQRMVHKMPRLRGEGKHDIKYRHIIDSLIRKPGAFENYKYKEDMFPTTRFRIVYDVLLKNKTPRKAAKEYLAILNLAAKGSEELVNEAIHILLQENDERIIDFEAVKGVYRTLKNENRPRRIDIQVREVNLKMYDRLFTNKEAPEWIAVN